MSSNNHRDLFVSGVVTCFYYGQCALNNAKTYPLLEHYYYHQYIIPFKSDMFCLYYLLWNCTQNVVIKSKKLMKIYIHTLTKDVLGILR